VDAVLGGRALVLVVVDVLDRDASASVPGASSSVSLVTIANE
jgi:hypothetical protein